MLIKIDFIKTKTKEELYAQLQKELDLPLHFGKNLDALADVISGEVSLPLKIHFINMDLPQLEDFSDVIGTLKDLNENLEDFQFRYAIRPFGF